MKKFGKNAVLENFFLKKYSGHLEDTFYNPSGAFAHKVHYFFPQRPRTL